MREILFRGKTEDGKWVEGVFIPDCLESLKGIEVHWGFIKRHWIVEEDNDVKSETVEVARETVGQFTGLLDANGEKIFEGDIVEIYGRNFIVRFEKSRGGWFPFASGDGCGCCEDETYEPSSDGTVECDVIGNIHDNPELVEVTR